MSKLPGSRVAPVPSDRRNLALSENGFVLTEGGIVRRRDLLRSAAPAGLQEENAAFPAAPPRPDRRLFLRRSAAALVYLSAVPLWDRLARGVLAQQSPWTAPGMPPEVTPVGSFYNISKNLWDPVVDVRRWSLSIEGLVHHPFVLDYRQLTTGGPTVQEYVTLTCISNEVGGPLTGNALWRGVRLRDLLQSAGVKEGAVDLVMEGHDDYTDSIPIEKAMHPDTLLVWEMNGEPLTPAHGFPARLIVPGIYGMKNVKWIRRLEVVDYDYKGYWAQRGWSDVAHVKTWSRIDAPRSAQVRRGEEVVVGGLAYAGDRGVERVEVSFDGGVTWNRAELKEPLGPYAWRLWAHRWTPPGPGRHVILVRATDGTGVTQSEVRVGTLPDGAEGYHTRVLRA